MKIFYLTALLSVFCMISFQLMAADVSASESVEILFADYYANWAEGFQFNGRVIDSNGNIYSFEADGTGKTTGLSDEPMTMDQIRQAFNKNLKHAGKVKADELNNMTGLIAEAASGKMSQRVSMGMDMGTHALFAFHKTEDRLYRMILLKQTGDWHVHNTSSAAVKLTEWLKPDLGDQPQPLPAAR